jgi:glycosyltransferase involved in cell wall biosynthesis
MTVDQNCLVTENPSLKLQNTLFLLEDRVFTQPHPSGVTDLSLSHLRLLMRTGCSLTIGILSRLNQRDVLQVIATVQPKTSGIISVDDIQVALIPLIPSFGSISRLERLRQATFDPALFRCTALQRPENVIALQKLVDDSGADFIWAEHLLPATLAWRAQLGIPVIYSHHDWNWRIKSYQPGVRFKKRIEHWIGKRHEQTLVREVAACVSGSITEVKEIKSLGTKQVEYLPTLYEPVELPAQAILHDPPRLVHLGSMRATANMVGLQRFMEVAWPKLRSHHPELELWVIGELTGATQKLFDLLHQPGVICTGYVSDLGTVLRPYDIHLIPWENNTGTRTRIPLALNFNQALVSTRPAAACIPELLDGENCMLVDKLSQINIPIEQMLRKPGLRQRIAEAGRQTFLSNFVRSSVQPRFNHFIDVVLKN